MRPYHQYRIGGMMLLPHPVELAVRSGFVLSGPSECNSTFKHPSERLWIVFVRGMRVAVTAFSEEDALRDAKILIQPTDQEESDNSVFDLVNERYRLASGILSRWPRTSSRFDFSGYRL